MYNQKLKEEFLTESNYDKDTVSTYINSFDNMEKYEEQLNKDVSNMNLEELEGLLHFVKYRKMDRLSNLVSNIKVYTRWVYKKGYGTNEETPFNAILTPEYYEKFIYNKGDFYLTRNELLNFLEATPDYSMKACLLAVFEGIGGRGYRELSNMTMNDVYQDNGQWYVNLVNELDASIRRRHPISHELYNYLKLASETKVFRGLDGEVKYDLIESKYIFRYFISRRNAGMVDDLVGTKSDAKLYELYLKYFREKFGIMDKFEKFSLKELKYSGMMHYLNEEMNEQENINVITSDTVDAIADKFILPTQKAQGKTYIVYSKVKGMVVADFMKEAYGKDVEYDFSRSGRTVQN